MLKRLRREHLHHNAHYLHRRHKKHFSKKWGFIVLATLLLGLAIAIPQLSQNQSLFGRAVFYEGTEIKKQPAVNISSGGPSGKITKLKSFLKKQGASGVTNEFCRNMPNGKEGICVDLNKGGGLSCTLMLGKIDRGNHCSGGNNKVCCVTFVTTCVATRGEPKGEGICMDKNYKVTRKNSLGFTRTFNPCTERKNYAHFLSWGGLGGDFNPGPYCPGGPNFQCCVVNKSENSRRALIANSKVTFTDQYGCQPRDDLWNAQSINARDNLVNINESLIKLMSEVAKTNTIRISCLVKGHTYERSDNPKVDSDHSHGSAVDIDRVNGEYVDSNSDQAEALVNYLYNNRRGLKIKEVLAPSPWRVGEGFDSNYQHRDHIHIAVN